MSESRVRKIFYYKNYYLDFFENMDPKVREKLNWTLKLIATIDRVPSKYFRHLTGTDGIYEIRVLVGKSIFRIFCFFDQDELLILLNAFQKKSRKTPVKEIQLAQKLRKQYFDESKA